MIQSGETAAISPRFALASSAELRSASVSVERAAEITSKCDRVSDQAQSHFERHRQLWTNRQYGTLLARDGQRMTLRPPGMPDDRAAQLMRAADSMVLHRQARRMAKIERTANAMLGKGGRNNEYGIGR